MKLNNHQQYIVSKKGKGIIVLNAAAGSGKTTTTKETITEMIRNGVDPRRILAVTFTNKASREWQVRIGKETISGWDEKHESALDSQDEIPFLNLNEKDAKIFEFLTSWCTTIHASCYRLLKEFGDRRRVPSTKNGFDIKDIVNNILDMNNWSQLSYKNALHCVSLGIVNMVNPHQFASFIEPVLEVGTGVPINASEILEEIYIAYLRYMDRNGLIDFNMMLVDWWKMLDNPSIRARAKAKFDYIIVDEAQDTSKIQCNILFILAEDHKNILFVGDPRQSIYQWRGAVPSIMEEDFKLYWKDYELRSLPINYRSTKTIIDKSNKVIALNYKGREQYLMAVEPKADAENGADIETILTYDYEDMAKEIAERIGDHPEECFILSRTNSECEKLHANLCMLGVPCINISGGSLYNSKNVERLIAYLKLAVDYRGARNSIDVLTAVANIASDTFKSPINKRKHLETCTETRPWIDCGCPIVARKNVDRAYSRYYGQKSVEKAGGWWGIKDQISHRTRGGERIMYSYGAEDLVYFVEELEQYHGDALECIDYILDHSLVPYLLHEEGLNSSEDLGQSAGLEEFDIVKGFVEEGQTVEEFLDKFEEMDFDNGLAEQNAALIMTVHKSKGLERPRVFVNATRMPCSIPPVFPGQVRVYQRANFLEERNIFYVAVTRAEKEVYIMQSATYNGRETPTSPFIYEISAQEKKTNIVPYDETFALRQTLGYFITLEGENK